MANALICDTCTSVFPEDAEGSVSGMGTMSRFVNGQRRQEQRRMDTCPECVAGQEAYRRDRYNPEVSPKVMREIASRVKQEMASSDNGDDD